MFTLSEVKKSLIVALWFAFLCFPIVVIKVNTIENVIIWRWHNLAMIAIGSFFLSLIWRYFQENDQAGKKIWTKSLESNFPHKVEIPFHAKGLYFYRLSEGGGKQLGAGKLLMD